MALVINVTKSVDIPGEPESAIIRKLSHKELREASKIRQSEGVGFMKEIGAELLRALREANTERLNQIQEAQEATITSYDRDTLLRMGIVSWTYPIKPTCDVGQNGVDLLDEATAKFLAQEIFDFSRPETRAEAKNV